MNPLLIEPNSYSLPSLSLSKIYCKVYIVILGVYWDFYIFHINSIKTLTKQKKKGQMIRLLAIDKIKILIPEKKNKANPSLIRNLQILEEH